MAEPWQSGFPPLRKWLAESREETGGDTLTAAVPVILIEERVPERWLEVHDAGGRLITVIELLSPSNKTPEGAATYRERQQHFLAGGIRVVEINLIHGGVHAVAVPPPTAHAAAGDELRGLHHADGQGRRVLAPRGLRVPMREPLPTIRVPLRRGKPDVPLALQPLVDRCYRTGRYWLTTPATREFLPPAMDDGEAAWIEERQLTGGVA